jgi:hypothetical protein
VDLDLQTAVNAVNLVAKGDKLLVVIVDPSAHVRDVGLNFFRISYTSFCDGFGHGTGPHTINPKKSRGKRIYGRQAVCEPIRHFRNVSGSRLELGPPS